MTKSITWPALARLCTDDGRARGRFDIDGRRSLVAVDERRDAPFVSRLGREAGVDEADCGYVRNRGELAATRSAP